MFLLESYRPGKPMGKYIPANNVLYKNNNFNQRLQPLELLYTFQYIVSSFYIELTLA